MHLLSSTNFVPANIHLVKDTRTSSEDMIAPSLMNEDDMHEDYRGELDSKSYGWMNSRFIFQNEEQSKSDQVAEVHQYDMLAEMSAERV